MISFDYKPQGVCSRNIHLNLSDDGSKVLGDRVIEVLAGNTCGMKKTSCADQLTRAIEAARAEIA